MSLKVFVSYSHMDEEYRRKLDEHLSLLQRKNVISVWNDRKIIASENWAEKIDENLAQAEIVLILMSSSFLASNYCFDIEMKTALERHKMGLARVVPIVIRACRWDDGDLSMLQGLPTDAKPISTWSDADSAWLDVVMGLERLIGDFNEKKLLANKDVESGFAQCEMFKAWLNDTEIVLNHRKVNRVGLSDIYVSPDMEKHDDIKKKDIEIVSTDVILKGQKRYLICGEEQQGKTTLLKHLYVEYMRMGVLPVYIDGPDIRKSDLLHVVEKSLSVQYVGMDAISYIGLPNKVLLIDNFDRIGLNDTYRNVFLNSVCAEFKTVIIACHSSFFYVSGDIPVLDEFERTELLGFGNFKREEIAKKWIALGSEELIGEMELYSECDELKSHLDSVIKKNIVPPKPIYVLMLIQMFEAYARQNLELTSYGHCYQALIYQSFEKAKIKAKDFEKYLNVLTEISWAIFVNGGSLTVDQVETFFVEYGKKFLAVDGRSIIDKMTRHSILFSRDDLVNFKYPYIYYFFVGKKISESYVEDGSIKECVSHLLENLHREDYANIIIFIAHHTKDSWVLGEVKSVLNGLFPDSEQATLKTKELAFMDEFIKSIPRLVVERREIQKERELRNKRLDELDRVGDQDLEDLDILAKINKVFKGMEIAGQIIRNRHATMTRKALLDLSDSGISTGLRFLDYFIKLSDNSKKEIVRLVETKLLEQPGLSDREVRVHAESLYLHMTYGVINAVVRKIAAAVGSKEASEIYSELERQKDTPSYALITQAIELQFARVLKIESVSRTAEKLKHNPVCIRILKEMVVQHIYMFPTEYKTKQKLESLLDISVKGQRQMDRKLAGKA